MADIPNFIELLDIIYEARLFAIVPLFLIWLARETAAVLFQTQR